MTRIKKDGLGGVFRELGKLVEKMGELAGKEGRFETGREFGDRGVKGVYGFSFRLGPGGLEGPRVEPFGNVRADEGGEPRVEPEREPIVDVFEEADHVLVLAEIPGADESAIETELAHDVLRLVASGPGRRYRKEIRLPGAFAAEDLSRSFRNGILEIRLARAGRSS